MKVGVNLINFGPGATPAAFEQTARSVEEIGYHLLAISDHIAVTPDVSEQYPAPFYDPFALLAWLAAKTSRIELGTTVIILPYRHPLLVARLSANLDQLSGGRFVLGVGVGWARQEFEALGLPFEKRGAIANESLEAIRDLWTQDQVSYQGRFFRFENVATAPLPLRKPHPPIWVGGRSGAAIRRAARFGTGWHPINIRVDWLIREGLPALEREAEIAGRPRPALCPRIAVELTEKRVTDAKRPAGVGTIEQVRDDLRALEELGTAYLVLDTFTGDLEATRDPEASLKLLAELAETALDLPAERTR